MRCFCSLLAALEFFRFLRTVAGEEYSLVAQIGEDGIIHCCSTVHNEHTESMSIPSHIIVAFSLVAAIAVLLTICKICVYCHAEEKRNSCGSTVQRVSQQHIQQNLHNLQQPVTSLTSATVQRMTQQPIQLNVHNLQQPVTPLASDSVVICPERLTASPCPDADPPPPYEVAVASESYNKQIPYNFAYKH